MLSYSPKELLEGLLLGSHRDSKQESSSVLVLPAAGHLLGQGPSSPFPWDQSIVVVRVARRKRLSSELAMHSPGRSAISSALGRKFCPTLAMGGHQPVTHMAGGTLTTAQPSHASREEFFLLYVQTQSSAWYRFRLYFNSSLCWAAAAMFSRAAVQAGSTAPDILCSVCLQQISRL